MTFKPTRFAVLLAGFVASFGALAQESTNVGTVTVQGTDSTSTGQIVQEETPKARSSVNREYLDKQSPVGNPYQAISQLPGVSTFSYDATGLYGGALRIRGFNSDQLGFTVNGAPVNDSGNFAVYPQEYTDVENLCSIFVTQGSSDTNAPHVGASGGNVGLVSCAPSDERRLRANQSFGSLNLFKTFVRLDTGLIGKTKTFISYSKSMADKFKGDGRADKQHVDFGSEYDLTSASKITLSLLYNRAINNNYRTLNSDQYRANPYLDYGLTAPNHLTPSAAAGAAGVQTETVPADGYFKSNINPFENAVATATGSFKLSDALHLDVSPYFWYGFGTGGGQLNATAEGTTGLNGGVRDLNGDGDTRDTVLTYGSSVTRTFRPGVTSTLTLTLPNNTIAIGGWYERAHHRQTAPRQKLFGNGLAADSTSDKWLDNPDAWLLYQNGAPIENRNWYTVSTGYSGFVSDTISLFRDRLTVVPALSYRGIERNFTNYANSGSSGSFNSFADYNVKNSFDEFLPSLGVRYALTDTQSIYANATKNFRSPSNFIYSNLLRSNVVTNGTYVNQFVNGQYVNYSQRSAPVINETSWNYETGYRYASQRVTASTAVFYNQFKNRIAQAYNPETDSVTDYNVGNSKQYGVEGEVGVNVYGPITAYASASYLRSEIENDLRSGSTAAAASAPTSGKQFPDTPNVLAALTLQYQDKFGYFGVIQTKYTGRRQSTLVNDANIPGYATLDLAGGYTYPGSIAFIQKPFIRFNASNVTNEEYLNLTGPSGSSFTVSGRGTTYYVGAPDFFSVTIGSDF